jgi:hypothetical protein
MDVIVARKVKRISCNKPMAQLPHAYLLPLLHMFEEQTIQSRGICSPIRLSDEFVTQELASIKIASIQS